MGQNQIWATDSIPCIKIERTQMAYKIIHCGVKVYTFFPYYMGNFRAIQVYKLKIMLMFNKEYQFTHF